MAYTTNTQHAYISGSRPACFSACLLLGRSLLGRSLLGRSLLGLLLACWSDTKPNEEEDDDERTMTNDDDDDDVDDSL